MLMLFGFLLMVVLYVVVGGLSGAGVAMFIDFPSLLIILFPLIFFLAATKSGKIIGGYIGSSFQKNYPYTKAELAGISRAVKNTIKFIIGTAGFGFLVGVMACLMYLEKTEYLGPNLAISLMTVLYGISIGYFVFFPVQAWADNKVNDLPDNSN